MPLTTQHNSTTCSLGAEGRACEACAWANGVEASRRCVLHPDRPAVYTVQGILVCDKDYWKYREEYLSGVSSNNTQLHSRPFLQRLIRVSTERFEETHAQD